MKRFLYLVLTSVFMMFFCSSTIASQTYIVKSTSVYLDEGFFTLCFLGNDRKTNYCVNFLDASGKDWTTAEKVKKGSCIKFTADLKDNGRTAVNLIEFKTVKCSSNIK